MRPFKLVGSGVRATICSKLSESTLYHDRPDGLQATTSQLQGLSGDRANRLSLANAAVSTHQPASATMLSVGRREIWFFRTLSDGSR